MTGTILMFSLLALVLVLWVLRRNARDRETFERELEEDLRDDGDTRD